MVGFVGVDGYGGEYLEQLTQEGVDTKGMSRSANVRTGTASIQVDSKGQNTIIIVQGANLEFLPASFAGLEETIAQSTVVLCQNEIPFETTEHTLQLCQKHNTISVLNPAPASMRMLELLPYCDIFCPNETELASLSGLPTGSDDQIRAAGDKLLALGCKVLLVTLGARGACLIRPGEFVLFPLSQVVTPVDTVGAGDSFIGKRTGTYLHIQSSATGCIISTDLNIWYLIVVSQVLWPRTSPGTSPSTTPCPAPSCAPRSRSPRKAHRARAPR
jgi:ribokinase